MEIRMTTKEAYVAMLTFLTELYDEFGYDQLGGILGGMSLLEDGTPRDQAYWHDWLRHIEISKSATQPWVNTQDGHHDEPRLFHEKSWESIQKIIGLQLNWIGIVGSFVFHDFVFGLFS